MKITLELDEETAALHIVAVTRGKWTDLQLIDVSVPTEKLKDGVIISIPELREENKP